MKPGIYLQAVLLLGIASNLSCPWCAVAETRRPNILYFYVDDLGWGAIGPNGQAQRKASGLPYVQTPNLDLLARQGINFTRGYGCHVCSPARSSQQSGFHQGHTFADRNDPNNAKKAMRADDILMGDALSAAGYVTGYWGKWGYGGSKDRDHPVIDNVQTLPTSHGYQYVLAELHHVRAHTFFQPTLWSAPAGPNAVGGLQLIPNSMSPYQNHRRYPHTPALQDHADYPDTAYCDDVYAFAALDFVRRQGQNYNSSGQPFFGLLAVQIPHAPFGEIEALPAWDQAYADDPHFSTLASQTRQWAAMVTRIDAHFGNVLAALEDPNNDGDTSDSIADNTLVIFQSDNGGPSGKNNVELDANGGLRGNKGKIQEGGIRVPLVMRWPANIHSDSELAAGSSSDMIVDVTDLLPTFCELAGAPIPLGVDGVSIAPTLTGRGHQRQREFIIHEASNGQSIIRGRHKLVRTRNAAVELYDLEVDHAEANNIAAAHPELVQQLEQLLLDERVTEPKGFAITYHRWIGESRASTSDSDHWSDYTYANAGITYLHDGGAPRRSWVARVHNSGDEDNTASADEDLEFLAGGDREFVVAGQQVHRRLTTLRRSKFAVSVVVEQSRRLHEHRRFLLRPFDQLAQRGQRVDQGGPPRWICLGDRSKQLDQARGGLTIGGVRLRDLQQLLDRLTRVVLLLRCEFGGFTSEPTRLFAVGRHVGATTEDVDERLPPLQRARDRFGALQRVLVIRRLGQDDLQNPQRAFLIAEVFAQQPGRPKQRPVTIFALLQIGQR